MVIEHSIRTSARPETVFAIYEKVEQWPSWDPDTQAAILADGLSLGSKGLLTPTKGKAVPMEVTAVMPNRSFMVSSAIPLFKMTFEHELTPTGKETTITHRVHFSGALAFLLGRVIGKQLNQGLPITLQRLKALAESTKTKG